MNSLEKIKEQNLGGSEFQSGHPPKTGGDAQCNCISRGRELHGNYLASKILRGILKTGRIANAYLFTGLPEGGKEFAAIQFAKALNCKDGGCEECSSCIKIGELAHPDVHLITPEQEKDSISIEQIRIMQKEAYLKPFIARFKVYIIEEAGKMTEEAANSLLKILEEPPRDTVFILTTSSPQSLLHTIISRCQLIRFKEIHKIEKKNTELEKKVFLLINSSEILKVLDEIKNLARNKEEVEEILNFLALFYRDVLLLKERDEELIIFKERIEQIRDIEKKLSEDFILHILKDILKAKHLIARNVNPRLTLESLFLNSIFSNFN